MPDTVADARFRQDFYEALGTEPLAPGGRRAPHWHPRLYPLGDDPLVAVADALTGPQSVQLVAGVRGTGRGWGLGALAEVLRSQQDIVVRVDLTTALSRRTPLAHLEVQVALQGCVDDALMDGPLHGALPGLSTWDRVSCLLPRGGARARPFAGGRVQRLLAASPTGGGRLAEALAGQEGEVGAALLQRHDDMLRALWQRRGPEARLVVIVEGADRLGPTGAIDPLCPGGGGRLLLAHGGVFAMPDTHVVVVAAPSSWWMRESLHLTLPGARVHWWPAVPLWDPSGAPDDARVAGLIELVHRFGNTERLIGDAAAWRDLVLASGGHLGSLLRLVREAVLAWGRDLQDHDLVAQVLRRARTGVRARLDPARVDVLGRVQRGEPLALDAHSLPGAPALQLLEEGLILGLAGESTGHDLALRTHPLCPELS